MRWTLGVCLAGFLVLILASCSRVPGGQANRPQPGRGQEGAAPLFPNLVDALSETTLEPLPAGEAGGARLKLRTDGSLRMTGELVIWSPDGPRKISESTNSPIGPGEIALAVVEEKSTAGKAVSVLKESIEGGVASIEVSLPVSGPRRAIGLPGPVVVKEGVPIAALALTAGKQPERARPDESLEETARRSEWAAVLTLKFTRRKDSHGVMLVVAGTPVQRREGTIRYSGTSLRGAIEGARNEAGPEEVKALAAAVVVDPNNRRVGTVSLAHVQIWIPSHTFSHAGGLPALTVERPDPESVAWELTAESRAAVKRLLGLP
jgi:hypothetical protein